MSKYFEITTDGGRMYTLPADFHGKSVTILPVLDENLKHCTQEQLGYNISAGALWFNGQPNAGTRYVIQYEPKVYDPESDEFFKDVIADYHRVLARMERIPPLSPLTSIGSQLRRAFRRSEQDSDTEISTLLANLLDCMALDMLPNERAAQRIEHERASDPNVLAAWKLESMKASEPVDRARAVDKAAKIVASSLTPPVPWDPLIRGLFRPSIADMTDPDDVTKIISKEWVERWMSVAKDSYNSALQHRLDAGENYGFYEKAPDSKNVPGQVATPREDPDWNWSSRLVKASSDMYVFEYLPVALNVQLFLTWHPDWRGVLRFNVASQQVELVGTKIRETARHPAVLRNTINTWFQMVPRIMDLDTAMIEEVIQQVARQNPYDPKSM